MNPLFKNKIINEAVVQLDNSRSQRERGDRSGDASKIHNVQKAQLNELQETLSKRLENSLGDRPLFNRKRTPDPRKIASDRVRDALEKTETLKSQILEGKEADPIFTRPENSTIYDFLETSSFPEGNAYTFQQKIMTDDEYESLNVQLFPAVVFDTDRLRDFQRASKDSWNVLHALGYAIDFNARTVTVPDGDLLNARVETLKEVYPELASFQAAQTSGVASDEQFLDLFNEGKTILSEDTEFLHDHLSHLIPELLMRAKGHYAPVRKTIAATVNPIRGFIKRTKAALEKSAVGKDEKANIQLEMAQLLSICTMWVDNVSSDLFHPQKGFDHHANLFNFIQLLDSDIDQSTVCFETLLVKTFNDHYPDDPITSQSASTYFALAAIVVFPNVVKSGHKKLGAKMFNLLEQSLPRIELQQRKDGILTFKRDSAPPLNIEDHPLEIIRLIKDTLSPSSQEGASAY